MGIIEFILKPLISKNKNSKLKIMKIAIFLSLAFISAPLISSNSNGCPRQESVSLTFVHVMDNASDRAFSRYAILQKALSEDDGSKAQNVAKDLVLALQDLAGAKEAEKTAFSISQTDDINVQRKLFAALTISLTKLFKANKPEKTMIYIQYCPMAKAYWLSESKEIQNPYLGKSMPNCGQTTGMIM
jgi:hypothetical protein